MGDFKRLDIFSTTSKIIGAILSNSQKEPNTTKDWIRAIPMSAKTKAAIVSLDFNTKDQRRPADKPLTIAKTGKYEPSDFPLKNSYNATMSWTGKRRKA